ncbi:MAG: hypothetical protein QNJ47_06515 [Nostocaceae cyanobacterium]|nr:hypothetical protein [Nostocaceae cyanobacterium]
MQVENTNADGFFISLVKQKAIGKGRSTELKVKNHRRTECGY